MREGCCSVENDLELAVMGRAGLTLVEMSETDTLGTGLGIMRSIQHVTLRGVQRAS